LREFSEHGGQLDFHVDLVARNPRAGQLYLRVNLGAFFQN